MEYDNLIKLLLVGFSLCLGSYLTALRNKISSIQIRNKMHFVFYILCVVIFVNASIAIIFYFKNVFYTGDKFQPDWFAVVVILFCFVSSVLLFNFTRKYLVGTHQYKSKDLDPIVNKFTRDADKKNIRLLAGDISFFGKYPRDIDNHSQFKCLKEQGFKEIQILCLEPTKNEEKIRYGKILHELPQIEFRYYHPAKADLLVRGRMKTLNNVTYLLIYNKIESGIYEAIETNTANLSGALYTHIWNLIWELAEIPSNTKLTEYTKLYKN
ncbi:hypothetical protein BH10BAC5_BH10BAC5_04580 [soil metagenome]